MDARSFYYWLGVTAYAIGQNENKSMSILSDINNVEFKPIMSAVKSVLYQPNNAAFILADNSLSVIGNLTEYELVENYMKNVKRVWFYQGDLYTYTMENDLYLSNDQLLLENVNKLIISEWLIYADDQAYATAYAISKFPKAVNLNITYKKVGLLYQLTFKIYGKEIDIKYVNGYERAMF